MYGKLHRSTFTGSMCGKGGNFIAMWAYIVANTNLDSTIELHPTYLASTIGCTIDEIKKIIGDLCSPDPDSRTTVEDGRRLIEVAQHQYLVVNFNLYNNVKSEAARREYMRQYMANRRAEKKSSELTTVTQKLTGVKVNCKEKLTSTSTATTTSTDSKNQEMSGKPDLSIHQIVFSHWCSTWNHPQAKLDDKRKRTISAALKLGYTPDELCGAISGYRNSQHHTGLNDRQTVYDDLGLLLRDAAHIDAGLAFHYKPQPETAIERFRRLNSSPPTGETFEHESPTALANTR